MFLVVLRPTPHPGSVPRPRWITEEDRQRGTEVRRERFERNELMTLFCRWLLARAGHDGPVTVPELKPEAEARLLSLLRQGRP
jgi:hypothetical protein